MVLIARFLLFIILGLSESEFVFCAISEAPDICPMLINDEDIEYG